MRKWGSGGRRFKSDHPDQLYQSALCQITVCLGLIGANAVFNQINHPIPFLSPAYLPTTCDGTQEQ